MDLLERLRSVALIEMVQNLPPKIISFPRKQISATLGKKIQIHGFSKERHSQSQRH